LLLSALSRFCAAFFLVVTSASAQQYDLLLRGGHIIDAKNNLSAVRDVAIAGGKIAAVAEKIDPAQAFKVVNVAGLYVTPGLVDIHTHVYTGRWPCQTSLGRRSGTAAACSHCADRLGAARSAVPC
jgi:dihydroorotase